MDGLVAGLPQSVKNVHQILRQQPLLSQGVNALDRSIIKGEGDLVVGEHQVDDGLTDHAQFHQTGVGVREQVSFSLFTELEENGERRL